MSSAIYFFTTFVLSVLLALLGLLVDPEPVFRWLVPGFCLFFYAASVLGLLARLEKIRLRNTLFQDMPRWSSPHERMHRFRTMAMVLLALCFMPLGSYVFGHHAASEKSDFYVASTSPETAVLFITSDDKAICAPFDRASKAVEPRFTILDIGDDPDVEYHYEEIGPLTLATSTPIPLPTNTPLPTSTPTSTPTATSTATSTPELTEAPLPTATTPS